MTAPAAAPISAQALDAALRAQLAPEQLQVIDESGQHAGHAAANSSGFGTHFRVRIAAARLRGQPRVVQHRMVYAALQGFIDRGVHAIAIEVL